MEWFWLVVVVFLVAWAIRQGSRPAAPADAPAPGTPAPAEASAAVPSLPPPAPPVTASLAEQLSAARHERDDLERTVVDLRAQVRALAVQLEMRPQASSSPAAPEAATTEGGTAQVRPAEAIGRAFVSWCVERGALVRLRPFFEQALRRSVPDATVASVFRDLNDDARPVRFDELGGAAPAEYWLVALGTDRWLLPAPQGPAQFRDVAPVFEGTVAPRDLREVVPAEAQGDGAALTLVAPGRLSSEAPAAAARPPTPPPPTAAPEAPTPGPPAPRPPPPLAGPPRSPLSKDDLVREFVAWCNREDELRGSRQAFEQALEAVASGFTVRAVFRDLVSPFRPIRFDATGGASPSEHWLVVTSEGARWLLPAPRAPGHFGDLSSVFEGIVAPKDLRSFTPAAVREDGGAYALTAPGRLA